MDRATNKFWLDFIEMDGPAQNGRHKINHHKEVYPPWLMIPQHQVNEQDNALVMNKKIMSIIEERDAAVRERNIAVAQMKEALAARDEALQQRDRALAERDSVLMDRDKVLAVLQCHDINFIKRGMQSGANRMHHPTDHTTDMAEALKMRETQVINALPVTVITSDTHKSHHTKQKEPNSPLKVKKSGEDIKRHDNGDVKRFKSEWDDLGLHLVNFNESTMPAPVCSCTGIARQCYKWGNGGWQSSCCTTALSSYPLPQLPNKRRSRVGGRKMSGGAFTKLLSRLTYEGHDTSFPVDLKNYWAKHGTNRYITIK